MINLTNAPRLVYTAPSAKTVTLRFVNTSNVNADLNAQTYYSVLHLGSSMGANATTEHSITLATGEYIVAYGSNTIECTVLDGANDVTTNTLLTGLDTIKTGAQAAVDVAWNALTAAQVRALYAIDLWNKGALHATTLRVKPLNKWVTNA